MVCEQGIVKGANWSRQPSWQRHSKTNRPTNWGGFFFTRFLLLTTFLLLIPSLSQALAASTLSEENYNKLQEIHRLIHKQHFTKAQRYVGMVLAKKINRYTQALFLHTSAQIALQRNRYPLAIQRLEKVLTLRALPIPAEKNSRYNLAQLYIQKGDDKRGLKHLEQWIKVQKTLTPNQHVFAASVFGREKQYKSAIYHIKKAIKQAKKSQESWHQWLVSFYLAQKQYKKAILVYHQLIRLYPKKQQYWRQLSDLYLQTKQKQQALATLELAHRHGLLKKENDILYLVDARLYARNPYQASKLLAQALKNKTVAPTSAHWRKLADSWLLAQELDNSIQALQQAARLTPKQGDIDVLIGRLHLQQGKWQRAYQSLSVGLSKDLDKPAEAHLLQGIAAYFALMPEKTAKAFNKAAKNKKREKKARAWLVPLE